jgi:hypothetical protein
MDSGRLHQLVRGPGIDTRVWCSLAFALGESVAEAAGAGQEGGVFVDIQLVPTGEQYTARVGTLYQGNGFGLYMGAIHKDDELLVEAPSGDPTMGLVVTECLSSAAEAPSSEALNNPSDVSLVVEENHSLRLKVQGSGTVIISTGGGEVQIATSGGEVKVETTGGSAVIDTGGGQVFLGGSETELLPMDGVVTGQGIDSFTGAPYFALNNSSPFVLAKKI